MNRYPKIINGEFTYALVNLKATFRNVSINGRSQSFVRKLREVLKGENKLAF